MPNLAARCAPALAMALLVVLAFPVTSLGTYGTPATASTTSVVGVLDATGMASAQFGFLDNNPADGSVAATEAIVLTFFADGVVHNLDILVSSGNGLTGSAGQTITSAPTGTLDYTVGATALNSMLRFIDTLPTYANGGPDGKLNPGEALFLDLDASSTPTANDRVITSGTGQSGAPGGAATAQSEAIWDDASECIYISTDATSDGLDTRIDDGPAVACALTQPLQALSGVKIAGDTTFTAGDEAYLATGTTVASGDYRLTDTAGGSAGSLVSCSVFGADADCGVALSTIASPSGSTMVTVGTLPYPLPATPFGFFDNNGNSVYDGTDRVVLDVDANDFVSPGDVRMNSAGSQSFGSFPTLSASSEVHAILAAVSPAPAIMWMDTTTNVGQIDADEPLAIHFGGGTLYLALGDLCLTTVGSCTAGSQRIGTTTAPTTTGTWKDVTTASNPGTLGYLDANNNNLYDVPDSLYLHFGAVPASIAAGDLLIASETGAAGTRTTATGGSLKALPFTPTYRYLDMDGSAALSVGDALYMDRENTAPHVADPGDIRLGTASGLTGFGKNVKEADSDAVAVLSNPSAAAVPFAFRDIDGSGGLSFDDAIYLLPRATGCPLTGADVLLSPGSLTATAGSFAGADVFACTVVPGAPRFAYTPTGVYSSTSTLYVDLDGDGTIETGDIRLTGGTFGTSGARVTGSSTDVNAQATLITLGTPKIVVHDASGDGIFAAGETVVLDMDGDLLFTPGDVPLSGTGVTGGGSTGGGGGGGGGGGTVNNPSTTTSVSSTGSTTSTSSTSTSRSNTMSSSEDGGGGGDDDPSDGDGGGDRGWVPGPGLAVLVLALAAAVLVARRKL